MTNSLKVHPNIKLIIIDTLQLVRGDVRKNETLYGNDYKDLAILKKFADKNHITILLIHHFRKMNDAGDAFNRFSGSTGIIGAADTMLALFKEKRESNKATFAISGRDIEDDELILSFNSNTCKWEVIGKYDELEKIEQKQIYASNPTIKTIRKILFESDENCFEITSSELYKKIIKYTGSRPKAKNAAGLTKEINKLQYDMLDYDGIYYSPPSTNGGANGRKMFFSISHSEDDKTIYTKEQGYI